MNVIDAIKEEISSEMITNFLMRHAAKQNCHVLLTHQGRVQRPFEVPIQQPLLARARKRQNDHRLLSSNIAVDISFPQEAPLGFSSHANCSAINHWAKIQWNAARDKFLSLKFENIVL